jgi:hypothetical protein
MSGNSDPIYSRRGAITRAVLLKTAAADYFGVSEFNKEVFASDTTNGSYLQRLRFKAVGTNVATVARVYINNGGPNQVFAAAPAAPTATPAITGGTMLAGSYYAQVIAIDASGQQSTIGAISLVATIASGSTGSIAWAWTAVPGAVSYRIYVTTNATAGNAVRYFTSATNSYSQTAMPVTGTFDDPMIGNTKLYGEVSLPATTISAVAATLDIDYPMNIALPPGYEVYVGLGTTVAAGWVVLPVGGDY